MSRITESHYRKEFRIGTTTVIVNEISGKDNIVGLFVRDDFGSDATVEGTPQELEMLAKGILDYINNQYGLTT